MRRTSPQNSTYLRRAEWVNPARRYCEHSFGGHWRLLNHRRTLSAFSPTLSVKAGMCQDEA
jgi:hypothetical protein